jgi:hypothetical protein
MKIQVSPSSGPNSPPTIQDNIFEGEEEEEEEAKGGEECRKSTLPLTGCLKSTRAKFQAQWKPIENERVDGGIHEEEVTEVEKEEEG